MAKQLRNNSLLNQVNAQQNNKKEEKVPNSVPEKVLVPTSTLKTTVNTVLTSETNTEEVSVTESELNVEETSTLTSINNIGDLVKSKFEAEKKVTKKQCSFYLDPDVIRALDKEAKKYGKGFKSDLVNSFLREYLKV